MLFRKKPVVVDAMRYDGTDECASALEQWSRHKIERVRGIDVKSKLRVYTLEGVIWADVGDWLIRGVKGEYYPCKPDIFHATYEPVNV